MKCQTGSLYIMFTCLMIDISKISHLTLPCRTPHTFFLSVIFTPVYSLASLKIANKYQVPMNRNRKEMKGLIMVVVVIASK